MWNTIKLKFHGKGLYAVYKRIAKECSKGNKEKSFAQLIGKTVGSLHSEIPLKEICSDIYGPLMEYAKLVRKGGFNYVLTMNDRHSRVCKLFPVKNIDAETVVNCLREWIRLYGVPNTLLTDQGRQYMSKSLRNVLKELGTRHLTTTAYNPTVNAIAERLNQELGKKLRILKKL